MLPNGHISHLTAVKRNRAGNVNTDRLIRRWAFLVGQVHLHSDTFTTRHNWVVRVAEMQAIQRVLLDRGVDPVLVDAVRSVASGWRP